MEIEAAVALLDASPDHLVLHRMRGRPECAPAPRDESDGVRLGLVVDFETTGLDPDRDRVIQLSALPFAFDRHRGAVLDVYDQLVAFEDPGRPIPEAVTALTGITDDHVRGRAIPDADVYDLARRSALLVAHNARFDRPFWDARFPDACDLYWGCSMNCVDWRAEGVNSAALDYVLYEHCGLFFDGHRADADCLATLHVLTTPFASGGTPLLRVIEAARIYTSRLSAVGAPYEKKDVLKERGYRWFPGGQDRPKAWYVDVDDDAVEAECEWLREAVYNGRDGWRTDRFNGRRRYSREVG